MARSPAPSKKDRHGKGQGKAVGTAHRRRNEVEPPPIMPGQHRCPVCRNVSTLTSLGSLRRHRDLFGLDCWNKATGDHEPIVAPPIVLPERPRPPVNPPRAASDSASRLDAGSECRECGKWLPGERSLCGRCYALRGRR